MKRLHCLVLGLLFGWAVSAKATADSTPQLQLSPDELRRNSIRGLFGLPHEPPKQTPDVEEKRREIVQDGFDQKPFSVLHKFAYRGHIGIHKGDSVTGPLLGFLACHKLVKSRKDATLYGFNVYGPLMEITALASDERMAIAAGQLGNNLSPVSKNFHIARHTRFSVAAGDGPQHDREQSIMYETTVFSYDPDDEEIEAQWVNADGNYVDAQIALHDNRIYYTGNINEFHAFADSEVQHVTFKWYPSSKA
ncbi:hypothetical protein CC1G_03872 [Coprinopsis cinerea okayama7|uniref:Secreted protein n=1 Tax=Coprinopsis cinerea (strain Okayama-7 / 130 / ATCC MYA-4618 / FGSC 9003) TaxID=240176 RepID=A8NH16_COPC7|nr:hypothetical protein CC1G_03872 [Coprinopsis cinerea okayama7\|eukprot:XP_001833655.2 hypothetical protein CC1G_03872 [Coprinopsis cinerea okayama7\